MTAWCKSVKQRSGKERERVKFDELILTSLETRCVQSMSVGDTLYLMILPCVSKGRAARFFADFACRCIYWTALSLYPLFCWVRSLSVNFATENRLLAIIAISDVGVGVSTKNWAFMISWNPSTMSKWRNSNWLLQPKSTESVIQQQQTFLRKKTISDIACKWTETLIANESANPKILKVTNQCQILWLHWIHLKLWKSTLKQKAVILMAHWKWFTDCMKVFMMLTKRFLYNKKWLTFLRKSNFWLNYLRKLIENVFLSVFLCFLCL